MTNGKAIIGLLACILLVLYTGNKLRKMFTIRGWLPGARVEMKVITGKQKTPGRHGSSYWISWDNKSPSTTGHHRVNLNHDQWETISLGDEIEVRYIGKDKSPYLPTGIYASIGNFGFDLILLIVELGGVVYCGLPLFKRKSAQPSVAK